MQAVSQKNTVETPTIYRILFAISFGHFLNDSMQAVVLSVVSYFGKNDEFILYASRVDCVCVKYDVIDYATYVWYVFR